MIGRGEISVMKYCNVNMRDTVDIYHGHEYMRISCAYQFITLLYNKT